jgi:hypothetical protein
MLKLSWPASRATLCKLERSSNRLAESIVLWRDNESFPRSIAPLRKDYVPLPWMTIAAIQSFVQAVAYSSGLHPKCSLTVEAVNFV